MSDWQLASTKEITAVQLRDELIIRVQGEKPTPCYEVRVVLSPLTIEPPEFVVQWRSKPGICPQIVVPYDIRGFFRIGYHDHILVRDKSGTKSVPVKIVKTFVDELLGRAEPRGGGGLPGPFKAAMETGKIRTATGYSVKMSFDEAFEDAVRALPPAEIHHTEPIEIVRVVEIGSESGGFVGFQRMFVKVEAVTQ
jgi:hypothetical protein